MWIFQLSVFKQQKPVFKRKQFTRQEYLRETQLYLLLLPALARLLHYSPNKAHVMIDVKSKSLIEFELSISKEQNQEVVLAKYDFDKEFCSLKPEHLQIHFTNQNDQLISKNTLKNQLRILSKLFISHPQITFKWLDCYDQDATEALDFHHLVHDFAFDIFLIHLLKLVILYLAL